MPGILQCVRLWSRRPVCLIPAALRGPLISLEPTLYIPEHFAESRTEVLHRLMASHPFATLVTQGAEGLDADHLPFLFDGSQGPHGSLIAHVARANPLWTRVVSGSPALVIFRASDGYISPNWYPSKHEAHRQVPTWNYQVVHAHGSLRIRDEERFVRRVVSLLTRRHEASEPRPWKMADAAPDHVEALLQNIVGIELAITRLEGKAKLSQNKELRDREGAMAALERLGQHALAGAMRDTLPIHKETSDE